MNRTTLVCLLLGLAGSCFGQSMGPLCPRHIEMPTYPPIARAAHVTGKVSLMVTIDAGGRVTNAEVTNNDRWVPLLKTAAIENIRTWTFTKPPSAPYTQTIVYVYELDPSLPSNHCSVAVTKVSFDLPDHITVSTNVDFINTEKSEN